MSLFKTTWTTITTQTTFFSFGPWPNLLFLLFFSFTFGPWPNLLSLLFLLFLLSFFEDNFFCVLKQLRQL